MMRKSMARLSVRLAALIVALVLGAPLLTSRAQDDGLNLIQTAEYDIGTECPEASALDPMGTTIWVLMSNCFQSKYALRAYNIADGSQVNEDDYADALAGLISPDIYIDAFITPMAFTPDGDLSIRYTNSETYESFNLLIPLASGGEATTESSADYDAMLAEYSEYPEYSIYSPDHTRVIASSGTSFHILDVQTQTEIVEIPYPDGQEFPLALFSGDGERLEVTYFNNPDDTDDHASTLLIYSLPGGDLLEEYQVPSPALWVSPDGVYAAVNLYSNNIGDQNEIVVMQLETGITSEASNLDEEPRPVTTCVNSGNNVSDVGFTTDGRFSMPNLHWLPDSSGLVLSLSYGGDAAGGRNVCIFNSSRLRTYQVETAD
jgi:hypothetical protein